MVPETEPAAARFWLPEDRRGVTEEVDWGCRRREGCEAAPRPHSYAKTPAVFLLGQPFIPWPPSLPLLR